MEKKAKVPKLRFPGFTDDWEQRKLGELGKCQSGIGFPDKEQGGTIGVPFYKVSDMNKTGNEHEMTSSNNYVTQEQIAHNGWKPIIELPAVIFAKVGAAIMLNRKRLVRSTFLLDNNTMAYKFDSSWDTQFGKTLFERLDLTKLAQIGALPSYNASDVEALGISRPTNLNEQQKIGEFFADLDNHITLHQRKLTHLQAKKKSLLQKMFPKKGERFPELRFPGFADAWEQRKLGEVAKFSKGSGYCKDDLVDKGIPIILYGRLYTKYQTKIINVDTFVAEQSNSVYSTGKEVIVPASGETAEDISIASAVMKSGILLGGDLNIVYPYETLNSVFLAVQLSNGNAKKEMSKRAQGKSVVHLHNADLQEAEISIPQIAEQQQIGCFFEQFDNLITFHQRKLTHLQKQKKALLQQMFV